MTTKREKGMTISEICIVIAVLAIVSVVVVSFAAMATGRGTVGVDKLKVMQDVELLEAVVDQWFAEVYTKPGDVEIVANNDTEALSLKDREGLTLQFAGSNLVAVFPVEGEMEPQTRTYRFEVITGLTFEIRSAKNGDTIEDDIFFCTVHYEYRSGQNKTGKGTYTFCINSRVGEELPAESIPAESTP